VTFIKQTPGQAAEYLAQVINEHLLLDEKVLWLLSGGSSIGLAVATRKRLEGKNLSNLTVTLIDERYGPDGHADSNWQQLLDSGFDFSGLNTVPVLRGLGLEETTAKFQDELSKQLKQADFKIALAGIGPDGHTSGILPDSPALSAKGLVTHYQGPDYQRITTTPKALELLDEAVVSLSDDKKKPIVAQLQQDITIEKMPAQLLKKLPRFIVFNNWIGEAL